MNLIMLGPPGAGKGTQSAFLVNKYDYLQLSTGDILREAISNNTPTGLLVKDILARGELVNDGMILDIMSEQISLSLAKPGRIFDGFPRTIAQAERLGDLLKSFDMAIDFIIELSVDQEVLIDRINKRINESREKRSDDNIQTLKKRIKVYYEQTMPIIDYYSKKIEVHKIDGMLNIGDISEIITQIIENK